MKNNVEIFLGDSFVDDRGVISFVNGLDLSDWKRFYIVENHKPNFIRAWHGHKIESKLVVPISGVTQVSAVKVSNWENPDKRETPKTHFLSSGKPSALFIPKGFANGFKSLTDDSKLLIFSSSTLDESKQDDFRFEWNYWDCWKEEYR